MDISGGGKGRKKLYRLRMLVLYFFREDSIINETYNIRKLDALEARYQRMKYLEKFQRFMELQKRQLVFN